MSIGGAVLVGLGMGLLALGGIAYCLLGGRGFAAIDQIIVVLCGVGLGLAVIGGAMLTAKRRRQ